MAKRRGFFPRHWDKLKSWLVNFKDKVAGHAAALGYSGGQVNTIKTLCAQLIKIIDDEIKAEADWHEAVDARNILHKSTLKKLSKRIKLGKLSDDYDTDIGKDLKWIGSQISIDELEAKPIITVRKAPNGWEFRFDKLDFFKGIKLYRKRPTEANYTRIATDTSSPYLDTDPQVDGTEYYAFYINQKEEEVGVQSDFVKIQV